MPFRIQRRSPPIMETITREVQVSPGNVEVDFFVNIYMDGDGNLEQGTRTFRNERNATACSHDTPDLTFVGTMQFTATLDYDASEPAERLDAEDFDQGAV